MILKYQWKTKNHFLLNKQNKYKECHSNKSSFFLFNSFKRCPYSCNLSSFSLAVVWKEFYFVNNDFILSLSSLIVPASRLFFLFSSVTSSLISFHFFYFSYSLVFGVFFSVLHKKQYIAVLMT